MLIVATLAVISGGCQQMATYPPVETTARLQRPAAEPVPTIVAQAIRHIRDTHLDGRELPINLPPGMPAEAYEKVFVHLEGGRAMQFAGEPAIHFTEIRTRSMNAQVDVIFPTTGGFHQFITITLGRSVFQEWKVEGERKWAMRSITPPGPNYTPPPVETQQDDVQTAQVGG